MNKHSNILVDLGRKIILRKIAYVIFILLILPSCADSPANKGLNEVTQEYIQPSPAGIETVDPTEPPEMDTYDVNMKRDLLCLMMAYPEFVSDVERVRSGEVYVVMKSGNKILYDDKTSKTYDQMFVNGDLQDTMEMLYPLADTFELSEGNYDPGRIRSYTLLKEVYGGARQVIEKSLEGVSIGGKVCSFNASNGAAQALKQAAKEISVLAKSRNNIYSNVFPVNGTYNYRVIAGTNQLSPHAFAIAIDFKSDKRDYWKWASRDLGQQRLSEYPREVVRILEEKNFIWGGKWAHFDILHFEYRPELIIKARYYVEDFEIGGHWYYGFPSEDEGVKRYIEIIDKI